MTTKEALAVVRSVCERGTYHGLAEARVTEQALSLLSGVVDAAIKTAEKVGHGAPPAGPKRVEQT